MIVLRDQEELSGPLQHCTNRIYVSHGSPDDSGAIAQLFIGQNRDATICCLFFPFCNRPYILVCGNQSVDALTSIEPLRSLVRLSIGSVAFVRYPWANRGNHLQKNPRLFENLPKMRLKQRKNYQIGG